VVNALHVWGLARAFGGKVTVRIEDHDRQRSRVEFEHGILDDLVWLGLMSDDESSTELHRHPSRFRQSDNADRYRAALGILETQGLVFPCRCTRREIAERVGTRSHEEPRYPGTCRDAGVPSSETAARRVRLERGVEDFEDLLIGQVSQDPAEQCGDLLIRDRHNNWTYQFAVVVDDIAHDIDVVIRGQDLLESTGRQIRLARLLGREVPPLFVHHRLVLHPDGSKLSKSNGDTGIRELREQGLSREEIFGLAAHAAGLLDGAAPIDLDGIVAVFRAR
jgi:glutamyl-tRNA synthetase/glutamyl-Q tRNA(Asp) synthetase